MRSVVLLSLWCRWQRHTQCKKRKEAGCPIGQFGPPDARLTILGQTFGQAYSIGPEYNPNLYDGVIGLAFNARDNMIGRNITMPMQNAINQGRGH